MKRTLTLALVAALLADCTAVGAQSNPDTNQVDTVESRLADAEAQIAALKSLNSAVATKLGTRTGA